MTKKELQSNILLAKLGQPLELTPSLIKEHWDFLLHNLGVVVRAPIERLYDHFNDDEPQVNVLDINSSVPIVFEDTVGELLIHRRSNNPVYYIRLSVQPSTTAADLHAWVREKSIVRVHE